MAPAGEMVMGGTGCPDGPAHSDPLPAAGMVHHPG